MPVRTSGFTSVEWNRAIEPDIQALTKKIAMQALVDAVARGFDPEPVVVTDGIVRRDPEQVKPFGKIEWIRRPILKEVALWILAELKRRSPVGPEEGGHYRDRFVLMINREQVENLDGLKPDDRVQIVNASPYAKKLEGQKANRRAKLKRNKRGTSRQAPGGIYTPIFKAAQARYGRSVFIDFVYLPLNLGGMTWRRKSKSGHRLRKAQRVAAVYPVFNLFVKPTIY